MCTRISAKKSQLPKIRRKSRRVKENFYELWKFFVDSPVQLGRWKRTGFDSRRNLELHENAPAGLGRSCVSGSLLSSGHAVARDGHANRLEVSNFCVLRTIQALSSVIGDERAREAGHRPRSTMSCTADDALLASWAFAKRKNCLECGDSRVRQQFASR